MRRLRKLSQSVGDLVEATAVSDLLRDEMMVAGLVHFQIQAMAVVEDLVPSLIQVTAVADDQFQVRDPAIQISSRFTNFLMEQIISTRLIHDCQSVVRVGSTRGLRLRLSVLQEVSI
jgi:hypothetical protein